MWCGHPETFDSAQQGIFQFHLKTFRAYSNYRNRVTHVIFPFFPFQDTESNLLKEARLKLEDVTFDIQCFISEHTQFLSPAQSSYLLKFLSTTQRAFRDQTENLVTQRSAMNVLLDTRERENQEKVCLWIYEKRFLNGTTMFTCLVCFMNIKVGAKYLQCM